MVRWTTVERIVKPVPPSKVRAIVIDPESRSIDETVMAATVPSLEALIGAPPLLYFRVRDGNLYGANVLPKTISLWRKEDFVFPGRVVIVRVAEDETHMLDTSINLEMLRNTVKFSVVGSEEWVGYEIARAPA